MTINPTLDRREFVKRAGLVTSGLVIAVHLPPLVRRGLEARTALLSPSVFLEITPDGAISLWLTKSEMGQGVHTALAMLIAEELDVEVARVHLRQATADPKFGRQGTFGSTSVSTMWEPLRTAGAQAREMLIGAAARTWRVPADQCRTEMGSVIHTRSSRRASYGALVPLAAGLPVPGQPQLKAPSRFTILGKSTPRVEAPSKVDGSARYGLDAKLPGMLYACIARCPVLGGQLRSFDPDGAKAVPGVRAVIPLPADEVRFENGARARLAGGVAVVADSTWAAIQACRTLSCTWNEGRHGGLDSTALMRQFRDRAGQAGIVGEREGDAPGALDRATNLVEATYELPFLAHATMEPMNCTADVRAGRCEIWAPTQNPTGTRRMAEKLTGLSGDQVIVHTTLLGGGFGRRGEVDFAADALRVSQAVRRPVQVVWTREHDMQHDAYRPASLHLLRAALDGGRIAAWHHRVVGPSILGWRNPDLLRTDPGGVAEQALDGAMGLPYRISHRQVEYCPVATPVPVGYWRSVYASQNCFANECFVDELARAASRDPLEFRRELLDQSPRHRRVLDRAAERAHWGGSLPTGMARGVAVHEFFSGAVVAEVAEVSLEAGALRVNRVVCAVDCGFALNPDSVAAQMEGGIVYGLSAALAGAITIEGGRVKQGSFDDYPVIRMRDMPRIEVDIVESADPPHGVGEPAVPPIAPAVANAVFQLTGARVRRLPLTSS